MPSNQALNSRRRTPLCELLALGAATAACGRTHSLPLYGIRALSLQARKPEQEDAFVHPEVERELLTTQLLLHLWECTNCRQRRQVAELKRAICSPEFRHSAESEKGIRIRRVGRGKRGTIRVVAAFARGEPLSDKIASGQPYPVLISAA